MHRTRAYFLFLKYRVDLSLRSWTLSFTSVKIPFAKRFLRDNRNNGGIERVDHREGGKILGIKGEAASILIRAGFRDGRYAEYEGLGGRCRAIKPRRKLD